MGKNVSSPDKAQKSAIDININAVVSAGAGSGKTRVLAKRFTDLLLRDKTCKVDQILTLTFTKKATVEMNSRIYDELSKADPEKAKDFYKANIKTFDSYCSQVARLGCHFYGVSPDFVIDEQGVIDRVESLALPFALKHRDNKAVKALVSTKNFDIIAKQLFSLTVLENSTIAEKIDFNRMLQEQYKIILDTWNKTCKALLNCFDRLKSEVENYSGNRSTKYISSLVSLLEENPGEVPAVNFDEPVSEERNNFIFIFNRFISLKKSSGSGTIELIKEIHEEIRNNVDVLHQLENYIYGTQFVNELIPLLEEFQNLVNDTKRSCGMLTYDDASSLALRILIDHPEIRNVEKEKYRYIMIDEFQDNNSMQRDLLFLLAEKKDRKEKSIPQVNELEKDKLFFVGDEKQSIYIFRGAEVSVFRGLAKAFPEGNLELKTNYRSHPALIAAFNSIFGGLSYPPNLKNKTITPCVFYTQKDEKDFSERNETIPDYEAVYHNVEIPQSKIDDLSKENPDEIFIPRVHFALYDKDQKLEDNYEDPDKAECYWVVNKIKELLEGVDGKKYEPGQIAILFRSYALLPIYEKILLNEGVPYVAEVVKGFFSDGPVNDIMSFLRLAAYPEDRLSFANILRSPFANLSNQEIQSVLCLNTDCDFLFDFDASNCLTGKSLEHYNNCQSVFYSICDLLKSESLAKVISYLWYETGYRYETLWNQNVYMYSSSYDRLFELARQADFDNTGLSDFVDSVDNYQSESIKLDGMEIPLESSDGIKIMSIHKSKGLEFPVVFICGTGHRGQSDSNSEVSFSSKEYGITINTPASPLSLKAGNFFYDKQVNIAKRKACAELRRLTYVALTRAESRLFITGACKFSELGIKNYSPSGDSVPATILDVLTPSLCYYKNCENPEDSPFTFEEIPPKEKDENGKHLFSRRQIKEKFKSKYSDAEIIQAEEPLSIYVSPSKLQEKDDETFEAGKTKILVDRKMPYYEIDELVKGSVTTDKNEPEFNYNNFGTIAHAYMEWAIKNEPVQILNREIIGLHGSEKKYSILDRCCRQMQSQFLTSATGKAVLDSLINEKFVKCEYSFKSKVAGKIINGQIDLLFENRDGSGYTIVDYKTNREMIASKYYNQLACYRDAVSKMFGVEKEKVKCILFYLRYGTEEDITDECNNVNLEKAVQVAE